MSCKPNSALMRSIKRRIQTHCWLQKTTYCIFQAPSHRPLARCGRPRRAKQRFSLAFEEGRTSANHDAEGRKAKWAAVLQGVLCRAGWGAQRWSSSMKRDSCGRHKSVLSPKSQPPPWRHPSTSAQTWRRSAQCGKGRRRLVSALSCPSVGPSTRCSTLERIHIQYMHMNP